MKIIKIKIATIMFLLICLFFTCFDTNSYGSTYEKNGFTYHGEPVKSGSSGIPLYKNIYGRPMYILSNSEECEMSFFYVDKSNLNEENSNARKECSNCKRIDYFYRSFNGKDKEVAVYQCLGHVDSIVKTPSTFDDSVIDIKDNINEEKGNFDNSNGGVGIGNIKRPVENATSVIILILQVFTLGGVIVTGIRYMYAGSESKAIIKKTLYFFIIGTVIVFAGKNMIGFIVQVFSDITKKST